MTLTLVSASKIKVSKKVQPKTKFGQLIQQAAAIQHEYRLLEQQLKKFRKTCTDYLQENELDQIECGDFRVSKVTHSKWNYSNKLELEMQRVEVSQKWEQSQAALGKGGASNSPTVSCSLSTIKNKTNNA